MRAISKLLQPDSLRKRALMFILLPTMGILLIMAVLSLVQVRQVLLLQWQQTAVARLQKAALQIDMRLLRPKRILTLFQQVSGTGMNRHVMEFLLERLRGLEGVVAVDLRWPEDDRRIAAGKVATGPMSATGMRYHRLAGVEVTQPMYDREFQHPVVSLVSVFRDADDRELGRIVVTINFHDLIKDLAESSWWQDNDVYLVDEQGNILTRERIVSGSQSAAEQGLAVFGSSGDFERQTLLALQENEYGTVFAPGTPPATVAGYYHLQEAPWTMVIVVPGREAFQRLIAFRNGFILTVILGTALLLYLLHKATASTTTAIGRVSEAAAELARGRFGEPMAVTSTDEVGELTRNFNTMSRQLRERLELQQALALASEIQQQLLPATECTLGGVTAIGRSLYCQETGGDYFDIMVDQRSGEELRVLVADVVGHGIGAALLMTTIRALARCRLSLPGSLDTVVADVNVLLCRDTAETGNFVSLFVLAINPHTRQLSWVRAGHEPALLVDCQSGEVTQLRGEGVVLGLDAGRPYREHGHRLENGPQLLVLGSDGIFECENAQGEQFGRERLVALLQGNRHRTPEQVLTVLFDTLALFRGDCEQRDDITAVVIHIAALEHTDGGASGG